MGKQFSRVNGYLRNNFKLWLKPDKKAREAICAICNNATINVEKIGVTGLIPHAQDKKHKCRLFFPSFLIILSRQYFRGI